MPALPLLVWAELAGPICSPLARLGVGRFHIADFDEFGG